jgi:hypothetical protein
MNTKESRQLEQGLVQRLRGARCRDRCGQRRGRESFGKQVEGPNRLLYSNKQGTNGGSGVGDGKGGICSRKVGRWLSLR